MAGLIAERMFARTRRDHRSITVQSTVMLICGVHASSVEANYNISSALSPSGPPLLVCTFPVCKALYLLKAKIVYARYNGGTTSSGGRGL
jgi:hypothetical protein